MHLPEHIRLTRMEPGCLSFEVAQIDDSMIWRVEELFSDEPAFEAHQDRAKGSTWGTATKAIRREYQISTDF
jgi:quinol monooxygenase YgiN